MLKIQETTQFRRDIKRLVRQGRKPELLFSVIEALANTVPLADKYLNHALMGNWRGYQECHIRPDWLLIYKIEEDILYLARSGSHAELF